MDAETVSVPDRAPSDRASPTGRVVVTGYGLMSLSQGSSRPTSVTLMGESAEQMRSIFDRLGLGAQAMCMEYESLYTIQFYDHGSQPPTMSAAGDFCGGDNVGVATGRTTGTTLSDPHCLLLAEVVKVLPARTASGTRDALHGCGSTYVG